MSDKQLSPQEAIEALKASTEVTVGPELIAAALRMSPSVLRKHVRDGEYHISAYDIQGSRIRFFRKDFLQKIGELPEDQPEESPLDVILKSLCNLLDGQTAIMRGLNLLMEEQLKKTAGAATPTE